MSQSASDRNALFAALALHVKLVTPESAVAAFQLCKGDNPRSMGDVMREQGTISAEVAGGLEAVLNAHVLSRGGVRQSLETPDFSDYVRLLSQDAEKGAWASLPESHNFANDSTGSFHRSPSTTPMESAANRPTTVAPDAGRYRIVRPHAKGGLGEVFVAEDVELHRQVALKEIQLRHAADAQSRERFILEAKVTGGLEHPGIVPVYGLGAYSDGRPFYAMRFIQGDDLKSACDRFHQAGLPYDGSEFRQLLGRFVDVCNAIAYAHSRGVLHRDLKPGNIMLGPFGETLVVDWGLAKFIGSGGAGPSEIAPANWAPGEAGQTMQGAIVGTPAFMSPEQAAGQTDQMLPATDVYILGATLYALLTNRPSIAAGDVAQMLQQVERGEFPRPRELRPAVPRPLEGVCLKAMALDPAARYATPLALAADLEHWLADEPVSCFREPVTVCASRWVRRHRTFVTSGAISGLLLILSLAVGLIVVTEYNRQLDQQKRQVVEANEQLADTNRDLEAANEQERAARLEAQSVFAFFRDRVLSAARPKSQDGGLGIEATIRQAIDAAEPRVAKAFSGQPAVEAEIRETMGVTYYYLGAPGLAIPQHQRARSLRSANLGPEHLDTLYAASNLGNALYAAGQFAQAIELYESLYPRLKTQLGEKHRYTLQALNNLAAIRRISGSAEEALPLAEQAFRLRKEEFGPRSIETLESQSNLAQVYADLKRLDEARQVAEEALRVLQSDYPDHPYTLTTMTTLANAYADTGEHAKALALNEKSLALKRTILGPTHPETLISINNLAQGYDSQGQTQRALPLFEEAYRHQVAELGADHPDTLATTSNLGWLYFRLGRQELALEFREKTAELAESKLGPDNPATLTYLSHLARAYSLLGMPDKALVTLERLRERWIAKAGESHAESLAATQELALTYYDLGQYEQALPLAERVLEMGKQNFGVDDNRTLTYMNNVALFKETMLKFDEAIALYEQVAKTHQTKFGPGDPITLDSMMNLAAGYDAVGQAERAEPIYRQIIAAQRENPKTDPRAIARSLGLFGANQLQQGRFESAEPLLRASLAAREARMPKDWTTFNVRAQLGMALAGQKKFEAAQPLLLNGFAGLEPLESMLPPRGKARAAKTLEAIIKLYDDWGQPEEAKKWRERPNQPPKS